MPLPPQPFHQKICRKSLRNVFVIGCSGALSSSLHLPSKMWCPVATLCSQAWDAEHFAGDAAKSCSRLRAAYVFCKNAAPASAVPQKKSAKSCCGMFANTLCFQTFAFWGLIYNALVRRTSWLPSGFPWQAWDAEHLAGDAASSCSPLRAAYAFCTNAAPASAAPPSKFAKSGLFANPACFQTFALWGLVYNALVRRTSWIFGLRSRFLRNFVAFHSVSFCSPCCGSSHRSAPPAPLFFS